MIKQRGSIMPALFDLLYREYCRARLAEMRKQLLIRPESHESHRDGAAGPDGGFGDDMTATQLAKLATFTDRRS
jgi:hypothetical protein